MPFAQEALAFWEKPFSFPQIMRATIRPMLGRSMGRWVGEFNQVGRLMIQGDSQRYVHSQNGDFHREVKANARSYDSLAALGAAFGLEFQDYMNFCADIYAAPVTEIGELSRTEERAKVIVWLAPGLSAENVTIAARLKTAPSGRASPLDAAFCPTWQPNADGAQVCEMDIGIADPEAILSVVVSYAGIVQQERSVSPVRMHVNSLRAALAAFQPDEDALQAVLANQKLRDRDPAELERAVAAILALRGFRVITADRIPGLQEVPDILAADADGNILVVECTLNTPNSEDKLAKLHRRREHIRRAFQGTRQSETEVLGLLAIPQTEETLRGYREQASRLQILMWNKDELNRLAQDESLPNSAEIFDGLRQALTMTEIYNGLLDGQDA